MTTATMDRLVREREAEFMTRAMIEYPSYLRAEAHWLRDFVKGLDMDDPVLRPDDEEVARLTLAVTSTEVRDVAWALMDHASAGTQRRLWNDVAGRVPERLRAAPYALAAFAAWLQGRDQEALALVRLSLAVDPAYRMAHLVRVAVVHGMPADAWESLPLDELPIFTKK